MSLASELLILVGLLVGLLVGYFSNRAELREQRRLKNEFHDELVKLSQTGPDGWHRTRVDGEQLSGVVVAGRGYLFTHEELKDARGRSQHNWR